MLHALALPIRTTRLLRVITGTILGWVVAALITGLLITSDDEPLQFDKSILFGVIAGLFSSWLELRLVPRYLHRTSAGLLLLLRTLFYGGMITAVVVIIAGLIGSEIEARPAWEIYQSPAFHDFLLSRRFGAVLLLFLGASFMINFVRQLGRMLGPGRLVGLFLGRYQQPVEEERLFMFLDLASSTSIAERLGPFKFNAFKNDFFYDLAEPVLATRGEIYQYVGDEVVISWKVRDGHPIGDALKCFFLIQEAVRSARGRYLKRYGVMPTFKAGIHGGPVVTAEVGDIKRDIVYSGDVVNTAARIEGQCRSLKRQVIVSGRVLTWSPPSAEMHVEDLGPRPLRGKDEDVHLYSVSLADAVVSPA